MAGSGTDNILISPVNVLWRIEARHCYQAVADSSDSLDGTYFTLMGTHYVWFDGPVAADPAPAGLTAIPVTYTSDGAASVIAGEVASAIDAVTGFSASASGADVTIDKDDVGEVADSADVDSGGVVTIVRRGKDYDLGLIQGDVAPNFAPANFEVQSQQSGVTVTSLLFQGFETVEVAIELQETTRSQLKELYKIWGGVFTPGGGGGTEVFGAGTGQIGKNMLIEAARLEMIPVNSVSSELSYNYNFMLALPVPETLTFSGENPRILSSTWRGFPDLNLANADTNTVLVGDASQDGL